MIATLPLRQHGESPLGSPSCSPFFEGDGVQIYHGDCRQILPKLGRFDLLLTDPPYEMAELPECLWGIAPCAYIFGDKRQVAENWYRQTRYPNKDFLVWHYRNSPKPKGRWRMSMQAIIYGWENGVARMNSSVFSMTSGRATRPFLQGLWLYYFLLFRVHSSWRLFFSCLQLPLLAGSSTNEAFLRNLWCSADVH